MPFSRYSHSSVGDLARSDNVTLALAARRKSWTASESPTEWHYCINHCIVGQYLISEGLLTTDGRSHTANISVTVRIVASEEAALSVIILYKNFNRKRFSHSLVFALYM